LAYKLGSGENMFYKLNAITIFICVFTLISCSKFNTKNTEYPDYSKAIIGTWISESTASESALVSQQTIYSFETNKDLEISFSSLNNKFKSISGKKLNETAKQANQYSLDGNKLTLTDKKRNKESEVQILFLSSQELHLEFANTSKMSFKRASPEQIDEFKNPASFSSQNELSGFKIDNTFLTHNLSKANEAEGQYQATACFYSQKEKLLGFSLFNSSSPKQDRKILIPAVVFLYIDGFNLNTTIEEPKVLSSSSFFVSNKERTAFTQGDRFTEKGCSVFLRRTDDLFFVDLRCIKTQLEHCQGQYNKQLPANNCQSVQTNIEMAFTCKPVLVD
jgi:hypothetical protein